MNIVSDQTFANITFSTNYPHQLICKKNESEVQITYDNESSAYSEQNQNITVYCDNLFPSTEYEIKFFSSGLTDCQLDKTSLRTSNLKTKHIHF
jgi:hypothetical protein